MKTQCLYAFWNLATRIGLRRLGGCLQTWYPSCYDDSLFFVDHGVMADGANENSPSTFRIALTIDNGMCRPTTVGEQGNPSMVQEVCQLLDKYQQAKATIFVCTEHTTSNDAAILLSNGHELGNHLKRDVSNHYCHLSESDFEKEILETNRYLEGITQQ